MATTFALGVESNRLPACNCMFVCWVGLAFVQSSLKSLALLTHCTAAQSNISPITKICLNFMHNCLFFNFTPFITQRHTKHKVTHSQQQQPWPSEINVKIIQNLKRNLNLNEHYLNSMRVKIMEWADVCKWFWVHRCVRLSGRTDGQLGLTNRFPLKVIWRSRLNRSSVYYTRLSNIWCLSFSNRSLQTTSSLLH